MLEFFARRLLQAIPVLILVSIIVFSILFLLPGDPATLMLAETGASAEAIAKLRTQMGLDLPPHIQYFNFVKNALQGDFGLSITSGRPVIAEIKTYLPPTLELAGVATLISVIIGITTGIIAALKRNSWVDAFMTVLALFGISMPSFWLGLMLIFFFSLRLGWFPATGQGGVERLILPAVTLGLTQAGTIARLTRTSMLEVLRQDYITTARGKGLREYLVILRHGLRNALIPVITILGLQVGSLLGGTVIVETVFARQGLGRLTVNAILYKDFRVVQGTALFSAIAFLSINLLVDFFYVFIDPRVRVK